MTTYKGNELVDQEHLLGPRTHIPIWYRFINGNTSDTSCSDQTPYTRPSIVILIQRPSRSKCQTETQIQKRVQQVRCRQNVFGQLRIKNWEQMDEENGLKNREITERRSGSQNRRLRTEAFESSDTQRTRRCELTLGETTIQKTNI